MSSIDTRRIQTHKMIKTTPAYSSQPEREPSAEIEKPNNHAPTTKVEVWVRQAISLLVGPPGVKDKVLPVIGNTDRLTITVGQN